MAAKGKSPVSLETKQAAFALRLQGLTNSQIGERLNLHPVTVSRIFTALKKLEAAGVVRKEVEPPTDNDVLRDWRNRLTKKSIKALDHGLDCNTDAYRRGTLGVSVLKGLGELQPDGTAIQINNLVNSMPAEMRSRYFIETEVVDDTTKHGETERAEKSSRLRREEPEGRHLVTSDE